MGRRRKNHKRSPVRTTQQPDAISRKKTQKKRKQLKRKLLETSSCQSCTCKKRLTRAAAKDLSKTSFASLNSSIKTRKSTIRYKRNDVPPKVPNNEPVYQPLEDRLQNTVTIPITEGPLNSIPYPNQPSVLCGMQPDILNYVDEFGDGTVQISKPDPAVKSFTSSDSLVVNDVLDMMEQYGLLESSHRELNFSELHAELLSDSESISDTKCEPLVSPNQEQGESKV